MNSTTEFESPKQVNAGLLNVGYVEAGSAAGPVVILLHGWPQAFVQALRDVERL